MGAEELVGVGDGEEEEEGGEAGRAGPARVDDWAVGRCRAGP